MSDTFIGHCKRCRLTKRFKAPVVSQRGMTVGHRPFTRTVYDKTRDVSGAEPFSGDRGTVIDYHDRPGVIWLTCPAGHSVEFRRVIGVVTSQPCSAKCLAAKGPSCECACGGSNHGASWS